MDSSDPRYHAAPLVWLTKQVLHKDTTLADRVRQLRYKRRKAKTQTIDEVCGQPAGSFKAYAAACDAAGGVDAVLTRQAMQPAGQVQEVGP